MVDEPERCGLSHPRADERHDLPHEEQAVISGIERGERAWPCHALL
jgi:hypothetical protein